MPRVRAVTQEVLHLWKVGLCQDDVRALISMVCTVEICFPSFMSNGLGCPCYGTTHTMTLACASSLCPLLLTLCFALISHLIKDSRWSFGSLVLKFLTWFQSLLSLQRYLQNLMILLVSSLVIHVVIHFYSIATDYLYTHRSTPKITSCIITVPLLRAFMILWKMRSQSCVHSPCQWLQKSTIISVVGKSHQWCSRFSAGMKPWTKFSSCTETWS